MTEDITVLTKEWVELLQCKHDDAALKMYCERIIPCLIPKMRSKFQSLTGYDAHYDGLISLLGFTPETVVLIHQFIKPDMLVVLHTNETSHLLDTVVRYSGISMDCFFHEPFVETPNTDIYRALEAALKRFPKGAHIAIELTGGKKTMGGALAVAAGVLDIDLLYIDYEKYMPEFRKPEPDSTYILLVGNPVRTSIDLFGTIEVNRAVEFFNVGKYDISKVLFEQSGQRMSNPRISEICSILSQFYSYWNAFAFADAFSLSSTLLHQTTRFFRQVSDHFDFDLVRLQQQIATVQELANKDRMSLLFNFFFSAERYYNNDQRDIAALLYYRVLEEVFDNAIQDTASGFDRGAPDYSLFGVEKDELLSKYHDFHSRLFPASGNQKKLPYKVAMIQALCLLGALDCLLMNTIDPFEVRDIANVRNMSVYAHGIQPIDGSSVKAIRELATNVLHQYIITIGADSIEEHRSGFEFMKLVRQEEQNT